MGSNNSTEASKPLQQTGYVELHANANIRCIVWDSVTFYGDVQEQLLKQGLMLCQHTDDNATSLFFLINYNNLLTISLTVIEK